MTSNELFDRVSRLSIEGAKVVQLVDTREAIGRRFNLLSEPCQEALLVASAIGMEFRVETVSAVCMRRVDQVRAVLESREVASFVSRASGGAGIYRFSDPVIRDCLYEEIPYARRPWIDRQVAESLGKQAGDGSRVHRGSKGSHSPSS